MSMLENKESLNVRSSSLKIRSTWQVVPFNNLGLNLTPPLAHVLTEMKALWQF